MGIKKLQEDINSLKEDKNLEMIISSPDAEFTLTIKDYHEIMYPRASESGYVAIGNKNKEKWSQRMYHTTEWYNHVDFKNNCYLSVNTFYTTQRQIRNTRHLNAFFVDLDVYNVGKGKDDVLDEVNFLVRTERILEPTFIISSGRGFYLIWKIEDVCGGSLKTRKLYNRIQERLVDIFKDLGADPNAKDIARVLRIPGTTNTKSNKKVEIIRYNPEKPYTLRIFQYWYNEGEEYKPSLKKHKPKMSVLKKMLTEASLNKSRAEDIESICYLRDYKVTGLRHLIVYLYYYYKKLLDGTHESALESTLKLNDKFSETLTRKEVESYITSAEKASEEHKLDKTKGYNYRNTTLIRLLNITKEEQMELKTIIEKEEKSRRDKLSKKLKRRNKDGLTSREVAKKETSQKIKELKSNGLSQSEIVKELNISLSTVKRNWNK